MRSGLESTSSRNYGAWVQSRNWVRYRAAPAADRRPGTAMDYSTGNTHLLSAILTKATRHEHLAVRAGSARPSRSASRCRGGRKIRRASTSAATTC